MGSSGLSHRVRAAAAVAAPPKPTATAAAAPAPFHRDSEEGATAATARADAVVRDAFLREEDMDDDDDEGDEKSGVRRSRPARPAHPAAVEIIAYSVLFSPPWALVLT